MNKKATNKLIIVGTSKYFKKMINAFPRLLFKAISKFCGLPIALVTLPIVIAKAKASNNGL